MQKNILTFAFLWASFALLAQQKFTISGYIRDAESKEELISASIFDKKSGKGTVSNNYGFFSLTLPAGKVSLKGSYVGYENFLQEINLRKDVELEILLRPASILQEVEITATKAEKIEESSQMSKIDVPIEQIKKIPALLGEVDVLKALQLLPGVQGGTEGANGIYVRGGGPDQNLITLDGVPVYNVSHLLGFFSVFNADALKNVTLYKGGFPARYGGRLSSVIDIQMKEGNMQKFHGEGSIGTVSSRLTLEGPIIKDKTSFIISGRRTYVDALMAPFIALAQASEDEKIKLRLYFYDLNAKINHKIGKKDRIYLSAYSGKDIFGSSLLEGSNSGSNKTDYYSKAYAGIDWGNLTSALRWNHEFNNKLFANTTLTYSRYNFQFGAESSTRENLNDTLDNFLARYKSGIKDWAGKIDFDYVPNPNHYIRFGANATAHTYNPGATQIKLAEGSSVDLDTLLGSQKTRANEYALYVEDDLRFGAFKANVGLHFSAFDVDNTFYTSLQPRIGINYLLNNSVALKGSFCTMRQYINLLTNEGLGLPSDLWVPSTAKVKPQDAWQAAVGVAKTLKEEYEVSIEGYYKKMSNLLAYKAGENFIGFDKDWQSKVTQGTGEAYGAEFLVQKKKGKFSGWIGYTLSWNNRTFKDLNNGKTFPFRYDRRHDIEIVSTYQVNKKWSLSATWVFGTGNAISLPNQSYSLPNDLSDYFSFNGNVSEKGKTKIAEFYNNNFISQPSEKNAYRMGNYHRLDVGAERKVKKKRGYESMWNFGFYNLYNRRNPFFITQGFDNKANRRVYKQVSILPIIPSISWGFKF
jgi:TonB-dependent Receptor Plug Domain/CarboxypepD_reg-like domain